MSYLREPKCGNCRWQKKAVVPFQGFPVGLSVERSFWNEGGANFTSIGAHYCEHPKQPRGLVLTNYHCPNYEPAPAIEDQKQIEPTHKLVGWGT